MLVKVKDLQKQPTNKMVLIKFSSNPNLKGSKGVLRLRQGLFTAVPFWDIKTSDDSGIVLADAEDILEIL